MRSLEDQPWYPSVRPLPASEPKMTVLIPCFNEASTISNVVSEFRRTLPEADIFVYDNNSTDATAARARDAGATVRRERRQGKGHVVRRMFADIDADVYLMVDGDATYDASAAREMVDRLLTEQLDMVVGARIPEEASVHRRGHAAGNAVFTRLLRILFGGSFTDVFSGYRVMSRRFVKSFPVRSDGFEIETELSAHAQQIVAPVAEVPTRYIARREGSESTLRTFRDGIRILFTTVRLFENIRPLQFFGGLFALLTALALFLGIPVIDEYMETGLVPRFPTAILAASIQTVAFICLSAGLVLKGIRSARQEIRRIAYLQYPAISEASDPARSPGSDD